MKKIILSVLVAGTLLATGCKKAKEAGNDLKNATEKAAGKALDVTKAAGNAVVDDAANAVGDAIESAISGISIPKFEDPKVGEHLKAYSEYAKDYIANKGDVLKNASLAKKGIELAKKGKEILGSLDSESAKKFKSVMSAIQSKMAPAK